MNPATIRESKDIQIRIQEGGTGKLTKYGTTKEKVGT